MFVFVILKQFLRTCSRGRSGSMIGTSVHCAEEAGGSRVTRNTVPALRRLAQLTGKGKWHRNLQKIWPEYKENGLLF